MSCKRRTARCVDAAARQRLHEPPRVLPLKSSAQCFSHPQSLPPPPPPLLSPQCRPHPLRHGDPRSSFRQGERPAPPLLTPVGQRLAAPNSPTAVSSPCGLLRQSRPVQRPHTSLYSSRQPRAQAALCTIDPSPPRRIAAPPQTPTITPSRRRHREHP